MCRRSSMPYLPALGKPEIRPLTTVVATSAQGLKHREPCSAIPPAPLQQCRRQHPPPTVDSNPQGLASLRLPTAPPGALWPAVAGCFGLPSPNSRTTLPRVVPSEAGVLVVDLPARSTAPCRQQSRNRLERRCALPGRLRQSECSLRVIERQSGNRCRAQQLPSPVAGLMRSRHYESKP